MREGNSTSGLNFKKSNIRIWIHQRNMTNLQQVVWEGHGPKLLVEHSNNPKIRKFLEAVPYIMGIIKDVHCDVQNGDLDNLKNRTAPPVPIAVLTSKDNNGLTPLHKAAGLDKQEIAQYIIDKVPNSINAVDNEGRTPLHYAAILKDDAKMFNFLIENGADESALDTRQKTAAYYKTRGSELDSKVLHVIPDVPRGAKEPTSFDWSMLSATPLSVNGAIRKAAEKIENGIKEKLDLKDGPNEEDSENPEEQNKSDTQSNPSSRKESIEEQEKSIEGESNENGEETSLETVVENKDNEHTESSEEKNEPNENNSEEDDNETNEPDNENPAENNTGETETAQDEEYENKSNEEETSLIENNTNDEEQKEKDKAEEAEVPKEDESNENKAETKEEEAESDLFTNNIVEEENTNASRPESKNGSTPSPSKSSHKSRPSTAVKEITEEEKEKDKANEESNEIEGEGVIEGKLHVVV